MEDNYNEHRSSEWGNMSRERERNENDRREQNDDGKVFEEVDPFLADKHNDNFYDR